MTHNTNNTNNTEPRDTDNDLRQLFADIKPRTGRDDLFMARLESRMDMADSVTARLDSQRRRSRMAVAAAAVTGFLAGMVTAILAPQNLALIEQFAAWIATSAYSITTSASTVADSHLVAASTVWILIAAMITLISFSAYQATMAITARATARR